MAAYAHWLREGGEKHRVEIHGWVFMTNHVHLLMTPLEERALSKLMQYLGRLYARYFNDRYGRTGTLFEDRFRSSIVDSDAYLLTCLRYIELNPVRAGMVSAPGDYRWSSYAAHAFGNRVGLWTPHPTYVALGATQSTRATAYRQIIDEALDRDILTEIRRCASKGLVLGTEKFRQQFEALTRDSSIS